MFSLESPHRGDSNQYTQYTIFNIKRKINLNFNKFAAVGFCPRHSKPSSKQPGKRANSVRAPEVLLYYDILPGKTVSSEARRPAVFKKKIQM